MEGNPVPNNLPQSEVVSGRARAVEAAIRILEESGPAGLTYSGVAARLNLSPAGLGRYVATYDDLLEGIAEHWFNPKIALMEEVVASDLPPRRKMYEFFARRFVIVRERYHADPVVFQAYCDIGNQHFDLVRSYVDLGDHYLCQIIGEAMADGHFPGLSIDEALSLINQMVAAYVNIALMALIMEKLTEAKLARIIDAIFDGLSAEARGAQSVSGLRAA
jgi:AcrR family transcriptional regulator